MNLVVAAVVVSVDNSANDIKTVYEYSVPGLLYPE